MQYSLRDAVADRDDGAPLREARAEPAVLRQPLAQAVEAFGDDLAGATASGFAPLSTLMPGMMPCSSSTCANGVPSDGRLADRLVEEDHAADVARPAPSVVNSISR